VSSEKKFWRGVIYRQRCDREGTRHLWHGKRSGRTLCGVRKKYPGHPVGAGFPGIKDCKRCYSSKTLEDY
jgi:hypothetical protein